MGIFESLIVTLADTLARWVPFFHARPISDLLEYLGVSATPEMSKLSLIASLMAVTFVFRHDWISSISSFLSLIFTRRKTESFDDWWLVQMLIIALPSVVVTNVESEKFQEILPFLERPAFILLVQGLALFYGLSRTRQNRTIFNWNLGDTIITSLVAAVSVLGGALPVPLIASYALQRDFDWEGTMKISLLASFPFLIAKTMSLSGVLILSQEMTAISSLSMAVSFIVGFALTIVCLNWLRLLQGQQIRFIAKMSLLIFFVDAGINLLTYF